MKHSILYVGLDVDDTQYHGAALDTDSGEEISFKCRPTLKGLLGQLEKLSQYFSQHTIKICYEASYVGYSLLRDLTAKGYHCDIVAPNLIPSPRSRQIKTDKRDARQLAQFYANGLLTPIAVPEPEQEQDRDLLRSRQKMIEQRTQLRTHIQSLLRRNGRSFKQETRFKNHWTKPHYSWLNSVIEESTGSFKQNLSLLIRQLRNSSETLIEYDKQVEDLAKTPRYEQQVQALTCYKGIKNLFALTIITEVGDIKRFPHPRKLTSWGGMDIREYSSGGKHNRFGLTKQGNRYLRTAVIEANQRAYRSVRVSKDLKSRRKNASAKMIAIADRCLQRLNKKGMRLLESGKHPNVVKVACAREMLGFIWESLNMATAEIG